MTEQPEAKRVEILALPPAAIHALAAGDPEAAERASPVPLGDSFVEPGDTVWAYRSRQVDEDPSCLDWITGVVWDPQRRLAVGRAGFHGPPDGSGMVEVGYTVAPQHRRQGYARAALEALLERARREPGVTRVRASISPDNAASLALVAQYGFVEVGEQWDEEDGLELVLEVDARGRLR